jgi:UPF0755 protein
MKNKFLVAASSALVALAAIAVIAASSFYYFNRPVDRAAEATMYTVPKGASAVAIAADLASKGFIRSPRFAYLYARFFGLTLKAGTYKISASMGASSILRYIHDGKQEYIRVTVPEGLSLSKTARHLEAAGVVNAEAFIAAAEDRALLGKYRITGKTAEGYLFPDTYFFSYENDAASVVETMIDNFFRKVAAIPGAPSDPEEMHKKVILASIVEREYRVDAEAPLIASVFENRLKINMGLQSCATIEYIITEIEKKPHPTRLMLTDLAIPNDYNTYKWAGLPPGPISSPGTVALGAAFKPADTHYLYFRLTDPDAGTHTFTRTLDQHVEAGHHLVLKKAAGD